MVGGVGLSRRASDRVVGAELLGMGHGRRRSSQFGFGKRGRLARRSKAAKLSGLDVAPQSCSPSESSETVKPLASFNLQFNIEVIDEQAIAGLQRTHPYFPMGPENHYAPEQ